MVRSTKIAFAALLAGTLVAGVGAGMTVVECSTFQYETLEIENGDQGLSESTSIDIGSGSSVHISVPYSKDCNAVADETVPQGTMSITARASSLADKIVIDGPRVWTEPEQQSQGKKQVTTVSVYPMAYNSGTSQLFQHKDEILQGLKNGVVYQLPSIYDGFSVEIRANPADIARLSF